MNVSSFSSLTLMLLLMTLVLLFINLVFSALICMPYVVEVSSRRSTRLANSNSEPAYLDVTRGSELCHIVYVYYLYYVFPVVCSRMLFCNQWRVYV